MSRKKDHKIWGSFLKPSGGEPAQFFRYSFEDLSGYRKDGISVGHP